MHRLDAGTQINFADLMDLVVDPQAGQRAPYRGPRQILPDYDIVDALVHAISVGQHRPSDQRKDQERLPLSYREGVVMREPSDFFVPERLINRAQITSITRGFLSGFADYVLSEAQNAITQADLDELARNRKSIVKPHQGYAVRTNRKGVYFEIDTVARSTPAEVREDFAGFVDDVKAKWRAAIMKVLGDARTLDTIHRALQVAEEIDIHVVYRDAIQRLEWIRRHAESPEDREAFLFFLRQCVSILGCPELDVEILTAEQSLLYNCKGLFNSMGSNGVPSIAIPLSIHGTENRLEWDDILEIIAHEVAHYQMDNAKQLESPKLTTDDVVTWALVDRNRGLLKPCYQNTPLPASSRTVAISEMKKRVEDQLATLGYPELKLNFIDSQETEEYRIRTVFTKGGTTITVHTPIGDLTPRTWEVLLNELCYNLAHHQQSKQEPLPSDLQTKAHNFTHTAVAGENLRRLRACRIALMTENRLPDGTPLPLVMCPFGEDVSPVIPQMMNSYKPEGQDADWKLLDTLVPSSQTPPQWKASFPTPEGASVWLALGA